MRGDLIQRVTVAGTVVPRKKTIITPPYNGYIHQIFVEVGDHVKAGAPILSIAQSLGMTEQIYPLRAPFSGTVVQVLKSEGEYVEQNAQEKAILRIDDLNQLMVEASAPEMEIPQLRLNQEVVIKASPILNRSYHGKIRRISIAAKEQKDWEKTRVEFPLTIQVTDQDKDLKPGMSVVVDVITQQKNKVLLLGHEFIQKDRDHYFVVLADNRRQPIDVGLQNEEAFEIRKGLSEGEEVKQMDFLSQAKEQK